MRGRTDETTMAVCGNWEAGDSYTGVHYIILYIYEYVWQCS